MGKSSSKKGKGKSNKDEQLPRRIKDLLKKVEQGTTSNTTKQRAALMSMANASSEAINKVCINAANGEGLGRIPKSDVFTQANAAKELGIVPQQARNQYISLLGQHDHLARIALPLYDETAKDSDKKRTENIEKVWLNLEMLDGYAKIVVLEAARKMDVKSKVDKTSKPRAEAVLG